MAIQLQGPQVIDFSAGNRQEAQMRQQQTGQLAQTIQDERQRQIAAMDAQVAPYIQQYGMEGFAALNPELAAKYAQMKGLPAEALKPALQLGIAIKQGARDPAMFEQLRRQTGWNSDQMFATVQALSKYEGAPAQETTPTPTAPSEVSVSGGFQTFPGGGQSAPQAAGPAPAPTGTPPLDRYQQTIMEMSKAAKSTPITGIQIAGQQQATNTRATEFDPAAAEAIFRKAYPDYNPAQIAAAVKAAAQVAATPATESVDAKGIKPDAATAADLPAADRIGRQKEWVDRRTTIAQQVAAQEKQNVPVRWNADRTVDLNAEKRTKAVSDRMVAWEKANPQPLNQNPREPASAQAAASTPAQGGLPAGGQTDTAITRWMTSDEGSKTAISQFAAKTLGSDPAAQESFQQINAALFNPADKSMYIDKNGDIVGSGVEAMKKTSAGQKALQVMQTTAKELVRKTAEATNVGAAATGAVKFALALQSGAAPEETDAAAMSRVAAQVAGGKPPTSAQRAQVSDPLNAYYSSLVDKLQSQDEVTMALFPKQASLVLGMSKEKADQMKTIADAEYMKSNRKGKDLENYLVAKYGDAFKEAELKAIYFDMQYKDFMARLSAQDAAAKAQVGGMELKDLVGFMTLMKDDKTKEGAARYSQALGYADAIFQGAGFRGNVEVTNPIRLPWVDEEYKASVATQNLLRGGGNGTTGGVGGVMDSALQVTGRK